MEGAIGIGGGPDRAVPRAWSAITRRRFVLGLGAVVGAAVACTREVPDVGPAGAPVRWPGEWEPHRATLMSFPWQPAIYGRRLEAAQREWAMVAAAIARFEPVIAVVPLGSSTPMRRLIGPGDVEVLELAYDDGWLRDNGPLFVQRDGATVGLDWRFNGWGGAFDRFGQTWRADDALPRALCRELGVPRSRVDLVLEGGAVLSDGAGTILTTEECLLDPSRNPDLTKEQIERALLDHLGGSSVAWLPFGLVGDLTGGHVDGVAMTLDGRRVLAQTDPKDPRERERLDANLEVLKAVRNAAGERFDVIELPILPRARFAGGPVVAHSYLNLAFARGAVIVPLAGIADPDRRALAFLREVFPDREVVGIPVPTMTWAGGGVHCVTQPLPAG
jgi:agmatine deiminase